MVFDWMKSKVPRASFLKSRMNDEVMIVCADSLIIYYLNATAAFLLNNVDGVSTVDEIKQKFLAKYAVDERELENDLIEVVRDLQWKKILILE